MLNFTVGPVQSNETVRSIGYEQVPYFRTAEFSELILENEYLVKKMAGAMTDSRVAFITGSGTAAMESAIMNVFDRTDKVLVVNGGSFGQRFVEMCALHGIPYIEIKLNPGQELTEDMLRPYENAGYTGFLVNVHETSTGVRYDMGLIGNFCHRNHLLLVADAISTFLADPINMKDQWIDLMITSSQKALACPPGISLIILSPRALERVKAHKCSCMYLDLNLSLKNGERGQTPFTPAVGILRQIHIRLREISAAGGAKSEIAKVARLAADFRQRIKDLPIEITSESLSNAVTPLHPLNVSAYDIFLMLKDEYGIWVCPNGGELADRIFRVGHIGDLTIEDNTILINALRDLWEKGRL